MEQYECVAAPVDIVREAIGSLNSGTDRFYEYLSDDVVYQPFGTRGRAACRQADEQLWQLIPDHQRVIEGITANGDEVYVWTVVTGTANGRPVRAEFNGHFTVQDGKITAINSFFDHDDLLRQLAP
jgi:ketosteroid isomerase-like protein